ncbi:sulfotransferase family protein [Actibacterium sp. D379-3]
MTVIEPAPVIILASRGAQGSLLATLLGGHPQLYGAPHLNVLAFEQAWQQHLYCHVPRDSNYHGLLRFLGQCLTGEQTVQSVQTARRWLGVRAARSSREIYAEMMALVAPRRLVDYSPLYAQNIEVMRRVADALPTAKLIHLVRNPVAQAKAISPAVWQTINANLGYWAERGLNHPCMDAFEIGDHLVDWSVTPPVFDPQFSWYRTQKAAVDLFAELPPERCIRLNAEDLVADPKATLAGLLGALDVACDDAMIQAMLSCEAPDYVQAGPFEAPMGVDFDMIGATVGALVGKAVPGDPINPLAPLPWRGDNDVFQAEVLDLAQELGYCVAS